LKEVTRSVDAALRMRSGAHSGSIGVFASRASHFITLFGTGNTRSADGDLKPENGDDDQAGHHGDVLPELAYRAVPARFRGL
jgi:iron complex outermembrane recepter protein